MLVSPEYDQAVKVGSGRRVRLLLLVKFMKLGRIT